MEVSYFRGVVFSYSFSIYCAAYHGIWCSVRPVGSECYNYWTCSFLCHSVISDLVTGIVGMIDTSIHYCTGGYLPQVQEGVVCLESTGDTLCS